MRASGRSTKSILTWRSWWRTRTPPSGRSSSPLTSWPTSPSGCLWTGSTRDGKEDVLTLDKIETHIKFCKVPTKPVTEPRVSEIIQCVMNKSWHHATFTWRGDKNLFYPTKEYKHLACWYLHGTGIWWIKCVEIGVLSITESNQPNLAGRQSDIQS